MQYSREGASFDKNLVSSAAAVVPPGFVLFNPNFCSDQISCCAAGAPFYPRQCSPTPPFIKFSQEEQQELYSHKPLLRQLKLADSFSATSPPPPSSLHLPETANLMAFLNSHSPPISIEAPSSSGSSATSEIFQQASAASQAFASPPRPSVSPPANLNLSRQAPPRRLMSSKFPKGRFLKGDHIVYDIAVRLSGEERPQLEVSPITVYTFDPQLVNGRQIAVNGSYITYGLRTGSIRVLNINTASRALLKGHSLRITDMAFFADDIHLLASACSEGRVFVWKIEEGIGDDGKTQIREQIVFAIQFTGNWDSIHPLVCWDPRNQEVLYVAIRNNVLKINMEEARSFVAGGVFSAQDLSECHIDKLLEGIYFAGKHDGTVMSLSSYAWGTSYLASSSEDGTIIIWEGSKLVPVTTFKPHGGQPVGSVAFITDTHSPDNVYLLTSGLVNHELKLWGCESSEGHLLSSCSDKWLCIQTLEFRSSSEQRVENAFFNQVMILATANVILLANAKQNAIYAIHIEHGLRPLCIYMDYLAEFSVTTPILSFTATNENASIGEGTIKIYCIQTKAIQQYTLDKSQCFPPPVELQSQQEESMSYVFEKSSLSLFSPLEPCSGLGTVLETSSIATTSSVSAIVDTLHICNHLDNDPSSSQVTVPLSPKLKMLDRKNPSDDSHSSLQSERFTVKDSQVQTTHGATNDSSSLSNNQSVTKCRVDAFSPQDGEVKSEQDVAVTINPSIGIKSEFSTAPSSLAKSSDAMSTTDTLSLHQLSGKIIEIPKNLNGGTQKSSSVPSQLKIQDTVDSFQQPGECSFLKGANYLHSSPDSQILESSCKITNQADMLSPDAVESEPIQPVGEAEVTETKEQFLKDISNKAFVPVSNTSASQSHTGSKRKKNKKVTSMLLPSSSPSGTPFPSVGSSDGEPSSTSSVPPEDALTSQISSMRDMLAQLLNMQEWQKQMVTAASVPVTKEGKRIEMVLGQRMERLLKAHVDALWAKVQEENAKCERLDRQVAVSVNNTINKELPATLEKIVKREIGNLGPAVGRLVTQSVEKSITTAVNDALQKGINDKIIPFLEKSVGTRIDAVVSRHIQTQFQSSVKHALQDSLRHCFEASVIPAFDQSCKVMFEQVDSTFRNGMTEHLSSAQKQYSASHTQLASTLKDTMASASSLVQSLNNELADGQRKLLALVENAHANPSASVLNSLNSNGCTVRLPQQAITVEHLEKSLDPTTELTRLVSEGNLQEAFSKALQPGDVSIVSWLCSQVDFISICSTVPLPLSQGVLLALVHYLSFELDKDTSNKLSWIIEASNVLDPHDPQVAHCARKYLTPVYQNLHRLQGTPGTDAKSLRLALHVLNSLLAACEG